MTGRYLRKKFHSPFLWKGWLFRVGSKFFPRRRRSSLPRRDSYSSIFFVSRSNFPHIFLPFYKVDSQDSADLIFGYGSQR
mmetsp:Transcript_3323/g.2777  ORF Transcript_3323/g.2777 Transcript_3323/m.2777 type:complete len:80 (-) Transcript_3323:91-330(-)